MALSCLVILITLSFSSRLVMPLPWPSHCGHLNITSENGWQLATNKDAKPNPAIELFMLQFNSEKKELEKYRVLDVIQEFVRKVEPFGYAMQMSIINGTAPCEHGKISWNDCPGLMICGQLNVIYKDRVKRKHCCQATVSPEHTIRNEGDYENQLP